MDQTASGRNISGTKQTQISGQLCKYTNVVKGLCFIDDSIYFNVRN